MAAVIERGGRRALLVLGGLALLFAGCAGKPTRELVAELRARDAADRLHAVKALAERRGDAAVVVPALADAVRGDADAFVRRDAAEALGALGPAARPAAPALLAAAQDRNAGVRKAAAKALARIDPDAAAVAAR